MSDMGEDAVPESPHDGPDDPEEVEDSAQDEAAAEQSGVEGEAGSDARPPA